jgi:hypothetical protein
MGKCLSCRPAYDNTDATIRGHTRDRRQNSANYFRYSEGRRFHNEEDCPYPLPNDLTEVDR